MLHRFKNVVARCTTKTRGSVTSKRGASVGVRFTPFANLDVDESDKAFARAIEVFPKDSKAEKSRLWPKPGAPVQVPPTKSVAPPVDEKKPEDEAPEDEKPADDAAADETTEMDAVTDESAGADEGEGAEGGEGGEESAEDGGETLQLEELNAKDSVALVTSTEDLDALDALDREERANKQRASVLRAIEKHRETLEGGDDE